MRPASVPLKVRGQIGRICDGRRTILAWSAVFSFAWLTPAAAQLPEIRSTLSGVYTEEQAEQGAEVFKSICSECHGSSYPLWGPQFVNVWSGQSLWRLYEFVSMSMPYGKGGSLTSEQSRTAIAYILQRNGYPAGDAPFPEEMIEIAFINFDPHLEPGAELTAPDGEKK